MQTKQVRSLNQSHIRNFCIIAHIDHGKSTLADRLLEMTHTVEKRNMQEQLLDSNPIERERGITIKLAPVRMLYQHNANEYILNLIDTPGHVDFGYEVSRSLQACEGAVLVVDATQGVQAQTLANLTLARKQNLTVIPVINKIDMPNALIDETREQLLELGFENADIITISAKTGTNIEQVLTAIIERIPAPKGETDKPLRALVFSSQYDTHKGVVVYVRIIDGEIEFVPDSVIEFLASASRTSPIELGYFMPKMKLCQKLSTGEVGYIATGLKDVAQAKIGDTITVLYSSSEPKVSREASKNYNDSSRQARTIVTPLPGYKEPKPMVFLGLYPIQSDEYPQVREALAKLRLSDSAFTFRPISSLALGNGFHCGFLGLLHAEVVQERISREFNLSLLATAPTVEYLLKLKTIHPYLKPDAQGYIHIQSAAEYPDPSLIEEIKEPIMQLTIFAPKQYVGAVMQLSQDKRGEYIELTYVGEQAKFTYLMPLSEMIIDFFDRLKSATQGYASLDYEFFDYQTVEVSRLDILLNHEKVDAFSQLVVTDKAESFGRSMVEKLKDEIPRQQFAIPVQATIGGKVVARADVKPFRKDVTQKLYGGDRTRKDKLLEAQKKGKKKMKMVGRVEIPQEAFLKVFKNN